MVPRSDAGDRRRQDRSPADALPMYGRHRCPRTVLASTTTLWPPALPLYEEGLMVKG